MKKSIALFTTIVFAASSLYAQDAKPLKVLLITGGCCHDYAKQKDILKKGIEERINAEVTQIHSDDKSTKPPLPIMGNPDYAKGFDLIIHDECAADFGDLTDIPHPKTKELQEQVNTASKKVKELEKAIIQFIREDAVAKLKIEDKTTVESLVSQLKADVDAKLVAKALEDLKKAKQDLAPLKKARDVAFVNNVLAPHKEGIPGVNLHCAMHCYRVASPGKPHAPGTDEALWFDYLGLQSSGHGPQLPITVTVADEKNPVTASIVGWVTGREELYNNIQITTGKSLARGKQGDGDKPGNNDSVVVWTNEYGAKKTKVFSTTIGHNNSTVEDPKYLDLVSNGILWATDKLGADGKPAKGYEPKKK